MAADRPRKTLDQIRREIDAEFVPVDEPAPLRDDPETDADDVDVNDVDGGFAAAWRSWRPYVRPVIVAAIVVNVFLVGYAVGRRHGERVVSPLAGSRVDTPAPPAASSAYEATTTETVSSTEPAAPAPAPDAVATETAGVETTTQNLVSAAASDDQRATPPAGTPVVPPSEAASSSPVLPARKPSARVAVAIREPGDWVESQRALRTALRDWLVRARYGSVRPNADDAEVILGADGQTAKTRIAVRVGGEVITREQRWTRTADGWSLIDDRQIDAPRS